MEKEQNKGRWFLFKHKCGAVFTMYTAKILSSFETQTVHHPLRCPGCFEAIDNSMKNELIGLSQDYTRTISVLEKQGYQIKETEITSEDLGF